MYMYIRNVLHVFVHRLSNVVRRVDRSRDRHAEKEEPGQVYHLLLILTDGTIDDMADTKHEIVQVKKTC